MAKWLWKQCWNFSALDSPAKYRSVSRRVVKFAIPHYHGTMCTNHGT